MLERPVELDREIRTFAHKVLAPESAHAPRRRTKKAARGGDAA